MDSIKHCPNDGASLDVRETRTRKIGWLTTLYRRKVCPVCGHTVKTAELPLDLVEDVLSDD
jgi:predicted RNA-binding Zn-ribbon protein involved in translation (DUF1610 family)